MSSTIETGGSGKFVDFDEYIDYQLSRTRAGIKSTDLLTTLAGVGSLVLGYLLVFTIFDHWVVDGGFSKGTRIWMLLGVIAGSLGLVTWKILLPWWKNVTSLYAAKLIEQSAPELKSSLINLIDLQRSKRNRNPQIERALEKRSAQHLSQIDVDHAIDRRGLLALTYLLLALVTACCLYALLSPKPISFLRPLTVANIPVATRTQIVEVTPGDADVLVRAPVEIRAVVRGKTPDGVTMHYTTADGAFVDEALQMTPLEGDPGVYQLLFSGENGNGLTQSVSYYITAGDARSEDFRLSVILAPSANVVQVDYRYPDYMQLEPRSQFVAAVDAWEGTEVTVRAESPNVPVASAVLQLLDENQLGRPMEIPVQVTDGTKLTATWKLAFRADGTHPKKYRIICTSEEGTPDPEPAEHHLTIRPDQSPEVALLDPTGDLERPANAVVPLLFKARDPDFQISYVTLRIEKAGEELASISLFEGKKQVVLDTYRWELQPLGLKAGDEVTFFVEARDNKHPSGNRKSSPPLKLRIVEPATPEQNEQQLQQDEAKQEDKLREEQAKQDAEEGKEGKQEGADGKSNEGEQGKEQNNTDKNDDSEDGKQSDDKQPGDKGEDPKGEPNDQTSNDGKNQQKNDKPNTGSDDSNPGSEQPQDDPQDGKKPGDEQKPLDDSGSDDAEALDRILKHQQDNKPSDNNPKQPGKDGDSNTSEADPKDGNNDPTSPNSPKPEGNDPKSASDDPNNDGTGETSKDPSDKPPMSSKPGEANDPMPSESNDSPAANSDKPNDNTGKTKPSNSNDPATEKRPGDPNSTGKAKPADKPDPNATRANDPDKIEREPGTSPTTTPSTEKRDPKMPPNDGDTTDPRNRNQTDPMTPRKNNGEPNQPPGPDEPSKGKGNPDAQKSKNPDSGEDGSSQKNADGTPADTGKGNSDPSTEPGKSEPNPQNKPGNPGDQKGPGSTKSENPDGNDPAPMNSADNKNNSQTNDGKQDSPSNNSQNAESKDANSDGKSNGKEGKGKDGSSNSNADAKDGKGANGDHGENADGKGSTGTASNPGKKNEQGDPKGPGTAPGERSANQTGSTEAGRPEEQNLDHAKQAADLVLRQLEKDLQRGEVDQELLKQLGWTEDQMRQFADRMRKMLDRPTEELTAEEKIKQRQFEEMLKNTDFTGKASTRSGSELEKQRVNGFGARKLPVPLEYREYIDAVTRDLSKQTTGSSEKSR